MGLGVAGAIGAKLARPEARRRLRHGRRRVPDVHEGDPDGACSTARPCSGSCSTTRACIGSSGSRGRPASATSPSTSRRSPTWPPSPQASGAHAERIDSPAELDGALDRARSALRDGRPAVLVCAIDTWDYPEGFVEFHREVWGLELPDEEECDMSWIQTGSTICFKPYTLEEALRGLPRRGSRTSRSVPSRASSSTSIPTGSGRRRSIRRGGCSTAHGQRCVSHERARVAPPRRGHAASPERPRRRPRQLRILVLNTFTGDAETPEEIEPFKANARVLADEAQAAGIRLCIETDSNLLPTAEIGHAAARRDRPRLDPDQLRPRQRRVLRRGQAGGRRQDGPRPVRARPPEGSARRQGRARLPSAR